MESFDRPRLTVPGQQFMRCAGTEDLDDMQLISLQKKFRCKRDLYAYLDQRGK